MSLEWNKAIWTFDAPGQGHTSQNFMNALESVLVQTGWSRPSWNTGGSPPYGGPTARYYLRTARSTEDYWWYNAEGFTQHCGIFIEDVTTQIKISCFVESFDHLSPAYYNTVGQKIILNLDISAPNNLLLVVGMYGLYVELGRDGVSNNLGQGKIMTHDIITDVSGLKMQANKHWWSQGITCNLLGSLVFCRQITPPVVQLTLQDGHLVRNLFYPEIVRGSQYVNTMTPLSKKQIFMLNVENWLQRENSYGQDGISLTELASTYGVLFPNDEGNWKVSDLWFKMVEDIVQFTYVKSSYGSYYIATDYKNTHKKIQKFKIVDHSILPFTFIQDQVEGKTYRVCRINDGGYYVNVALEWPLTDYLTVTP